MQQKSQFKNKCNASICAMQKYLQCKHKYNANTVATQKYLQCKNVQGTTIIMQTLKAMQTEVICTTNCNATIIAINNNGHAKLIAKISTRKKSCNAKICAMQTYLKCSINCKCIKMQCKINCDQQ